MMFFGVFAQFKQEYPDIKISLVEGTVLELSEQITAGTVDVAFLTNVLEYPHVVTRTLIKEEILLVVPCSHPLAGLADRAPPGELARVDLRSFEQNEFLVVGEGTTLRTLENRMFNQAGFKPRVIFETDRLSTLHMLSRGGFGLSFVPMFYAEKTEDAVYFRTNPAASWELVAACRRDHYVTRAEEYMIRLAAEYYR